MSAILTDAPTIRWMLRQDFQAVLAIEEANFDYPWTEADFIAALRQRNCIGMTALANKHGPIVGFYIYELHSNSFAITRMAVHAACQRKGIGQAMIESLALKLRGKRNRISCEVRETNLDAQLFFRACGFKATGILREFYEENGEDAYLMVYKQEAKCTTK